MSEAMTSTSPSSSSRKENSQSPLPFSESDDVYLTSPEYKTDEFRMKHFKIDKCPRLHAHDWTTCPLAHAGEKARRRDPEEFKYAAIACIDMKNNGHCPRGDSCPYAHNVFEYWMHPTRYRTQVCNDGTKCKRQICFFAHRLEELRTPPRKPGFPAEWNKGRKHKYQSNRNTHSKKKTATPRNDIGLKVVSEPVTEINSGLHRHGGKKDMVKEPLSSTALDGSLHRSMLGNVMQDARSVMRQHDAVYLPPMSSAAGHNFCNVRLSHCFADQQRHAVQSDTQTSREMQCYARTLERALYCPGADFTLEQNQERLTENDEHVTVPRGDLFRLGRMNPDLFLDIPCGYGAPNAPVPTGSSNTSPEASHIRSPQNIGPFPGMGSDLGSPVTPPGTEHSSLRLGQSLYNHHAYNNQRTILSEYHQQPFAY